MDTKKEKKKRLRVHTKNAPRRTRDGKRFVPMRFKFMAVLVSTAVLVVLLAVLLIPVALRIVQKVHMSPDNVDKRLDACMDDFAEYVAENNVKSDDTVNVVRWTRRHRTIYLTVFNDQENAFGAAGGELWQDGAQPDMSPFFNEIMPDEGISIDSNGTLYIVRFSDGLHKVALVDYSLATVADVTIIVGIILAVVVFFVINLLYYHSQTHAIVKLSRQVEVVSGGALDAVILNQRNDEIGRLAEDVDIMRSTILMRMDERERAWQANSDLLTSMTHDIRTPLTTLLGYMELLGTDNANMTEEQRDYIRVCAQKTEQIKGLSDQLFLYFWALNRAETEGTAELEPFEATLLFEQLIGEYIPAMEVAGLRVSAELSAISERAGVRVNLDCLRRVTDNVFDNMTKYADRSTPVTISAHMEQGTLAIRFSNAVGRLGDRPSGTRIGVRSCTSMMRLMGGGFDSYTDDDVYTAVLTLPTFDLAEP